MAINFPDSPSTNDTHVVGDKTWSWNGTYWHVKQGLTVSSIKDADNDTKVQVEESSDEDIIRFDTAGSERMTIAANGAVNVAGDMTVAGGDLSIGSTAAGETLNIAGVTTASGAGSNLIVKSGDATGTNLNGGYLALKPGMGTGSGVSGDILLQTGPAGSSGTTANTPATVLTAMSSGNIYVTNKLGIGESAPASDLVVRADSAAGRGGEITILNYATSTVGNEAALNFGLENSTYAGDVGNAQIKARLNATSGAADLIFSNWTGGAFTEHLRIMADGNVGIGTTAPTNDLSIDVPISTTQGMSLDYSGEAKAGFLLAPSTGEVRMGAINSTGDYFVTLYADNAEAMRIDKDGNVGIGTTSPDRLLTTSGAGTVLHHMNATDSNQSYTQYTNSTTGTTLYTDGLLVGLDTDESAIVWNQEATNLRFGSGGAERMTITNAGNVGIGTTSPQAPLSFANAVGQKIDLYHSTGGSGDRYGFEIQSSELRIHSGAGGVSTGGITFGKKTTSAFTEHMRIRNDGNVGIGTTAPAHPLHIGTDGGVLALGADSDLKISAGSNSFIDHNGNGDLWIRTRASGENMYFDTAASAKILVRRNDVVQMEFRDGATTHGGTDAAYGGVGFAGAGIFVDRNWGNYPGFTILNETAASDTNQGEFRIHGSNHSWSSFPATGGSDFGVVTRSDGGFATGSDERRKENITTISGALATVNSLRGVEFNTIIRDGSQETLATMGGKMYGFLAQEAKDLIPNVVTYYPDEDEPLESGWCSAYSINYAPVTAVLVEAIKELTTRLEALESA